MESQSNRPVVWGRYVLAWILGTLALDIAQYWIFRFDCVSEILSFLTGLGMFGSIVAIPVLLSAVWRTNPESSARLRYAFVVIGLCAGVGCFSGFLWLISHMCP